MSMRKRIDSRGIDRAGADGDERADRPVAAARPALPHRQPPPRHGRPAARRRRPGRMLSGHRRRPALRAQMVSPPLCRDRHRPARPAGAGGAARRADRQFPLAVRSGRDRGQRQLRLFHGRCAAREYVSIRDLIAAPPKRVELDLGRRAKICVQLAESFLELHASGFCYQDINFGNIFFNPETARILICDNDNVNIDGADASIYGTRKFMAPEVVRRETLPNSRTDLYSMSVLFFYTLLGWHPLDGRREHEVDADGRQCGAPAVRHRSALHLRSRQ